MSASYRTAIAVAALVLLSGCGAQSASPGAPGDDPARGATVPPTSGAIGSGPPPLPSSDPPATPALAPITPAAGFKDRVARWQLAGQSDGGRRLLLDVAIGGPPCDTVTGLHVAETATTVTVTVYAGRLHLADCPSGVAGSLATARVEATLGQPLGARELRNAG